MHQVCPPKHPNMKNLGEIVIRAAGWGDEEEILRCLAAAFEPYRAEYTPAAYADTVLDQASLKKRLQYMYVLVAVASEGIVGTVAASLVNGEGHLRGMAVRPECHATQMPLAIHQRGGDGAYNPFRCDRNQYVHVLQSFLKRCLIENCIGICFRRVFSPIRLKSGCQTAQNLFLITPARRPNNNFSQVLHIGMLRWANLVHLISED